MFSLYLHEKRQELEEQEKREEEKAKATVAARRLRHKLSDQFEGRVDIWLQADAPKEAPCTEPPKSPFHHTFRDRDPNMEIGSPTVSGRAYVTEKERIAKSLENTNYLLTPIEPKSTLLRVREKEKEIQPPLRYKPHTDLVRVQDAVNNSPASKHDIHGPFSPKDHPRFANFRLTDDNWQGRQRFNHNALHRHRFSHDFVQINGPYTPVDPAILDLKRVREKEVGATFETPKYIPYSPEGEIHRHCERPRSCSPVKSSKKYFATAKFIANENQYSARSYDLEMDSLLKRYNTSTDRESVALDVWATHKSPIRPPTTPSRNRTMYSPRTNSSPINHRRRIGTAPSSSSPARDRPGTRDDSRGSRYVAGNNGTPYKGTRDLKPKRLPSRDGGLTADGAPTTNNNLFLTPKQLPRLQERDR
mmetsp:Transcript_18802/g.44038  ORF Transcript_18802/g.44038 Transcript_18802/m.44038 type:complete len:418 (-) Transcript_18802:506-1759(-)